MNPARQTSNTDRGDAFAAHLVLFGRVLRRAGLKVGSGQILDAMRAVSLVGVRRREDVYQALYATLVTRQEQAALFDQAFHLFWRVPERLPDAVALLLSSVNAPTQPPGITRVQQALAEPQAVARQERQEEDAEERVEMLATYSAAEVLRQKDFADFTVDEAALARQMIRALRWPVPPRATRRRAPRGKDHFFDVRRTVRGMLRGHGELVALAFEGRKLQRRPIVVLCDISGSMEPYARMLLHFMHAFTEGMQRVESFVFGTRLTRITRYLRRRDIDEAVTAVARAVGDWGGGTRIGEALRTFNYTWLRRTLPSQGVLLVISDGWDRGEPDLLAREMARLSRSCYRLIWLNPLLGYAGYEPLTQGMQAALPYVDDFLSVHNLASLEQLGRVLSGLSRRPSRAQYVGRAF